jgi:divalent metal cation (Fe/Co/Zn/Cd) transporter
MTDPPSLPAAAAGQASTALVSLAAAALLVVLKLGTGIVTGSLGLISAGIEYSGAGFERGDAVAALVVAAIIFAAAGRPVYENARVPMDTAPADARARAQAAISGLGDAVELRRLRLRESGGHYFADAIVGVPPGQAVVESHGTADAVEAAVRDALPDTDVIVHLEPRRDGLTLRDRALAVVLRRQPGVQDVHTHLEPLEQPVAARPDEDRRHPDQTECERITTLVRDRTGRSPRELRLLHAAGGLVVFVSVAVPAEMSLADAHELAGRLEDDIRAGRPHMQDVVVHTEPGGVDGDR